MSWSNFTRCSKGVGVGEVDIGDVSSNASAQSSDTSGHVCAEWCYHVTNKYFATEQV